MATQTTQKGIKISELPIQNIPELPDYEHEIDKTNLYILSYDKDDYKNYQLDFDEILDRIVTASRDGKFVEEKLVLLEEKVDTIQTDVSLINDTIGTQQGDETVFQVLERNSSDIDTLEELMSNSETKVNEIESKLTSSIEPSISANSNDIQTLKEDSEEIKKEIYSVEIEGTLANEVSKKADKDNTYTIEGTNQKIEEYLYGGGGTSISPAEGSLAKQVQKNTADIQSIVSDKTLENKVTVLEESVSTINESIDGINEQLPTFALKSNLETTIEDVTQNTQSITSLNELVSGIRNEIGDSSSAKENDIYSRLNSVESVLETKADASQLTTLSDSYEEFKQETNNSINELETNVSDNQNSISTLTQNFNTLSSTVSENETDIESKVTTINEKVSTIEQNLTELTSTVDSNKNTIEQTVSDLQTKVDNNKAELDGEISTIKEDISSNQQKIEQNKSELDLNIEEINTKIGIDNSSSDIPSTGIYGRIENIENIIGEDVSHDGYTVFQKIENLKQYIGSKTDSHEIESVFGYINLVKTDLVSEIGTSLDPSSSDTVYGKIANLSERIDAIDITIGEEETGGILKDISDLKKEIADIKNYIGMEGSTSPNLTSRVTDVENTLSSLDGKVLFEN